jgi:Spy/CpxP family protein refolding chaperone
MKTRMIVASLAAMLLAASAMGQDQGGPPPGGGPGGGQRGFGGPPGGGMMRGQPGLMPAERLLQNGDVQTDLQLTSDQKDQLEKLRESMRSMRPPQGGPGGPGEDGSSDQDRQAQRLAFDAMREKNRAAIDAILTSDQKKRLREIAVQVAGKRAVNDPSVQNELELTSAQRAKIKTINEEAGNANRSVMEKMRNGDIDRDSAMQTFQSNQKVLENALNSVLTSDQQAKLAALGGKKFEGKVREGGPGGGGPGRGFGGPGGGFGGPGGGGPGGPGGPGDGGPPPGDGPPPPGDGGANR